MTIFIEMHDYLSTVMFLWPSWVNRPSVIFTFLCELCYVVVGEHFLTSDNQASVVDMVSLECHHINIRSALEVAVVCISHQSCLAMTTTRNENGSMMICSCPCEPIWPGLTSLTSISTVYLRTWNKILPGKSFSERNMTNQTWIFLHINDHN